MDYELLVQNVIQNPEKVHELLIELNNTSRILILNESGLHGNKDDCDLFMKCLEKDREQILDGFTKFKKHSHKKFLGDWVII